MPQGELDYSTGAFMGPPELNELHLDHQTLQALRSKLIDYQLYNAEQLNGKRAVLVRIIRELNLDTALVRTITQVYQGEMVHE